MGEGGWQRHSPSRQPAAAACRPCSPPIYPASLTDIVYPSILLLLLPLLLLQDFYLACTLGGILACGSTHTAVTPLDVVKCNLQTDPKAYTGIVQVLLLTVHCFHMHSTAWSRVSRV